MTSYSATSSPTLTPSGGISFLSKSQIRILLVPTSHCSISDFDSISSHVRKFTSIPLSELPKPQSSRSLPSSTLLSNGGEIHISFLTSYDPKHSFLAPFDLSSQVLGVLALGTCGKDGVDQVQDDEMRQTLIKTPGKLRELHPGALVHRCFGFDLGGKSRPSTSTGTSMEGERLKEDSTSTSHSNRNSTSGFSGLTSTGLIIFPSIRKDGKDVKFYLKTLLSDFISSLLDGLHEVTTGLDNHPLETPRETLDMQQSSSSSSSSSTTSTNKQEKDGLGGGLSATAGNVASNAASRASALFSSFGSGSTTTSTTTNSSSSTSTTSRPTSTSTPPSDSPKKTKRPTLTQSTTGTGPLGIGRHAKLKADSALLAGDLWRALEFYEVSMNSLGKERALAGGNDAVWYAGALEGWAQARVLTERAGGLIREKAPSMSLPIGTTAKTTEKSTKASEKEVVESPFSAAPWIQISEAYSLALTIYSKCLAPPSIFTSSIKSVTNETPRDYTHPLIHANACISYSRFLLAIWASGGWNGECFDQLLYGGIPPSLVEFSELDKSKIKSVFLKLSKDSLISRNEISIAASKALTYSSGVLKPTDQIQLLSSIANIFGCIGFNRKESYILRKLQSLIVTLIGKSILSQPKLKEIQTKPLKFDELNVEDFDHASKHSLGTLVSQIEKDNQEFGSDSILLLAAHVCEVYSINFDLEPLIGIPKSHILSRSEESRKSSPDSPLLNRSGSASSASNWGVSRSISQDRISSLTSNNNLLISLLTKSRKSFIDDSNDFGWKEQQIILLKDTICIAELLNDYISMTFFACILLRDFVDFLPPEEQWRLSIGLNKVFNFSILHDSSIGSLELGLNYWGPENLVLGLESIPLKDSLIPTEKESKELNPPIENKENGGKDVAGINNPFFWNPINSNKNFKNANNLILVESDPIEFMITLSNPLDIALEIPEVKLNTVGVKFQSHPVSTVVPPKSLQTLKLTGLPRESGDIIVKGCWITLLGCLAKEFTVPLHEVETEKAKIEEEFDLLDKKSRIKNWGLDSRPFIQNLKREELILSALNEESEMEPSIRKRILKPRVQDTYLKGKVLPSQPLLSIVSTSLNHGNLILFQGETKILKIKLQNLGHLPIDFLKLSFNDDLTTSTKTALLEGDLLAEDSHSLEYDLIHRPIFTLDSKMKSVRDVNILPGESKIIKIKVRGKLDCENGSIRFEYGHLNAPGRGGLVIEESQNFFTRSIELSFKLTVYPIVDLSPIEILPIRKGQALKLLAHSINVAERNWNREKLELGINEIQEIKEIESSESQATESEREPVDELSKREDEGDSSACLICLDIRNIHSFPIEITITLARDDSKPLVIKRPIASCNTSRFYLPTPLLSIPPEVLSSPIPSLSSRQFIVSKLKMTEKEEALSRKRFWFREYLMGKLNATWRELRSPNREGEINGLREMSLTDGMVQVLRRKDLDLQLNIDGLEKEDGSSKVKVEMEDFVNLKAQVTNNTSRPLRLFYRLLPLPFSNNSNNSTTNSTATSSPPSDPAISNLLITNGNLSGQISPWPLEAGQTTEIEAGVCFLSRGDYELAMVCEESTVPSFSMAGVKDQKSKAGMGQDLEERVRVVQNEGLQVQVI